MIFEPNLFKVIIDIILIVLIFSLFGFLHSYFASEKIKAKFKIYFPYMLPFYRLIYNFFAVIEVVFLFKFSPKPDVIIYDFQFPFDLIIIFFQFISIAGFIWTLNYFDAQEFLGLNQIKRWKNSNYDIETLDEQSELNFNGPYKYCRHPLYFFSILFLILRPTMNLFYFIFAVCSTVYFYVGTFFEEKRLVNKFGEKYISYQRNVPRIFPLKIK